MAIKSSGAAAKNEAFHDAFWQSCPDFSKYNPGVLHRRRALLRMLQAIRFDTILDVGCGTGELLLLLRAHFPTATFFGVDISSQTIATTSERLPFAELSTLNLEKEALPRSFDAVVCTEVIEHLDDPVTGVRNLAAMVAPGGHLLLTCPTGAVQATERHFGHVAHPTLAQLEHMLSSAGLVVESLENWGWPVYAAMKRATNVRPDWALKNFASGSYSRSAKAASKLLYWANFANFRSSPRGCQLFALARRP